MTAAHYDLDNLTAIVDRNRLQQGARTEETKRLEPLADKWRSFGWEVARGRRPRPRAAAARRSRPSDDRAGRSPSSPTPIKGKGVSFMEDRVEWHHKVPTADQVEPRSRSWPHDRRSSTRDATRPSTAARPSPRS